MRIKVACVVNFQDETKRVHSLFRNDFRRNSRPSSVEVCLRHAGNRRGMGNSGVGISSRRHRSRISSLESQGT